MRVNLVTPFADKDQVKALGARWDPARKLWYVLDPKDLAPFMRWIPDLVAATQAAAPSPTGRPTSHRPTAKHAPAATAPLVAVPDCGCAALPWEDCVHTLQR